MSTKSPQVPSSSKIVAHRILQVILCAALPLAIFFASIGLTVSACGQDGDEASGPGDVVRCTGTVFVCISVALIMGTFYGSSEILSPAGCVIVLFLVLICGEAWLTAMLPLIFKWDESTSIVLRIFVNILAGIFWLLPLICCCSLSMPGFYMSLAGSMEETQYPVVTHAVQNVQNQAPAPAKAQTVTTAGNGTSPQEVPLRTITVQAEASTSGSEPQNDPEPEVIFEAPEQVEWGTYQCPNHKHSMTDGPCECQPFTSDEGDR